MSPAAVKGSDGQAKWVEIHLYVFLVLVDVFGYFLLFVSTSVHVNSVSSCSLISLVSSWPMQNMATGKPEGNSSGRE